VGGVIYFGSIFGLIGLSGAMETAAKSGAKGVALVEGIGFLIWMIVVLIVGYAKSEKM
jgi:hypothetical protein